MDRLILSAVTGDGKRRRSPQDVAGMGRSAGCLKVTVGVLSLRLETLI